jgi:DNA-binding NtrC family response regulator
MGRPVVVLVADPDPGTRLAAREACEAGGLTVLEASSGAEVQELLGARAFEAVWFDPRTPGLQRERLLGSTSRLPATTVVVALASGREEQPAAELLRAGAFDVVAKPLDRERLGDLALRVRRQHELLVELAALRERLQQREGYHGLVGHSPAIERLRERLAQLAREDGPVGFAGEEGTGKELAARTLHGLALGPEAPFLSIDCASLGASGWEARWFGDGASAGILGQARGGTLHLDGPADLAPELQPRLGSVLGLGPAIERPEVPREFRLTWSTVRDPAQLIEEGRLVEPLAAGIARELLHVPPLRDRREDIPLLARHFVQEIGEINRLPPIRLSPEALSLLERHHWPGNVQELRSAMELAAILARDGVIRPADLPDPIRELAASHRAAREVRVTATKSFREAKRTVVEEFECAYLGDLLGRNQGNVTLAAQQAGRRRSALQRLLRKHRMRSSEFRRPRVEGASPRTRPA